MNEFFSPFTKGENNERVLLTILNCQIDRGRRTTMVGIEGDAKHWPQEWLRQLPLRMEAMQHAGVRRSEFRFAAYVLL